jgi:hypothetical protein
MTNRYAIIEDGIVANVVVADAEYAAQQGWVECPDAGPKWLYADGVFTKPEIIPVPEPEPIPVPEPAPAPTKEELLAQLNALAAQIQALE